MTKHKQPYIRNTKQETQMRKNKYITTQPTNSEGNDEERRVNRDFGIRNINIKTKIKTQPDNNTSVSQCH